MTQHQPAPLELALNEALTQYQIAATRVMSGPLGAADSKRPKAWREYGYPDVLNFDHFYWLYQRNGIAQGVIGQIIEKCWEENPEVIQGGEQDKSQDVKPWEKKVARILKDANFWHHFADADRMRMVGRYAAVLLQLKDASGDWSKPVSGSPTILKMIPAWENELKPDSFDENVNSPTYGDVTMWSYKETGLTVNGREGFKRELKVHPDRVLLIGDYYCGESSLKAPYNDFVNLEKISGGSGESFLKNAARQVSIEYDKDVNLAKIAAAHKLPVDQLQSVFDSVVKNINRGVDAAIMVQGGQVKPLVAAVADPEPHYRVALQGVVASYRVPMKIVIGSQTGERASTEDSDAMNKRCQGRRVNVIDMDARRSIAQLIRIKVLPPVSEFTLIWTDLTAATKAQRLANAKVMADTNSANLGTGEAPFTTQEIRTEGGFDPEPAEGELPKLPDTDPDTDPDEDDPAAEGNA